MRIESYDDRPPPADTDDFLQRLALKQVDTDIYTGWCHAGAPLRAFGGQVAAQALVAAGATVSQPDRHVHSLHGYFLRPGQTRDRIVYMVDRPREGRSFSTRRVRAMQYGEIIFSMAASFAPQQQGPTHQRDCEPEPTSDGPGHCAPPWFSAIPKPDEIAAERLFDHISLGQDLDREARTQLLLEAGYPEHQILEIRVIPPEDAHRLSGGLFDRMVWVRAPKGLPDDPMVHVCALTYFSDLLLVSTITGHHGGRRGVTGLDIASIDHAMWFHELFAADDWLLFATDSPIAGHGRGFARGTFHDQTGRLVASTAQEALLREPPGGPR